MLNLTLAQLEPQLAELSRTEKVELVRRLLGEFLNVWPGIEKTTRVAGGDACIVRTRIPVWALENYRRSGWSDAAILENYPLKVALSLQTYGHDVLTPGVVRDSPQCL